MSFSKCPDCSESRNKKRIKRLLHQLQRDNIIMLIIFWILVNLSYKVETRFFFFIWSGETLFNYWNFICQLLIFIVTFFLKLYLPTKPINSVSKLWFFRIVIDAWRIFKTQWIRPLFEILFCLENITLLF